jgi:hypothetical protein
MSSFQVVAEKVAQVASLTAGFVSQAAASLVGKAEKLSLDEMSRRLDGGLRALRGEDVSTSAGVTTAQKTSLQIVEEMIKSYAIDKKTGASTFTVPAGVTDVDAMKALNEYFRKNQPQLQIDAVCAPHLEWFENLPKEFPTYCETRDYSKARQITITAVVKGTTLVDRTTQGSVLEGESLVFSDPRDQALAAAILTCITGADLFKGLFVRGSVPGFVLHNLYDGVRFESHDGDGRFYRNVAASGSPSPELKKT